MTKRIAQNMPPTVHERLAVVETKLEGLEDTVNTTAADVRIIRDHILTEKGAKQNTRRAFAIAGGLVTTGAALRELVNRLF